MGIKKFFQKIFAQQQQEPLPIEPGLCLVDKELKLEPGLCLVDIELVKAGYLAMTGKTLEQELLKAIEACQDAISRAESRKNDAMTAQEALVQKMNEEIQGIRKRYAPDIQMFNTTVREAETEQTKGAMKIQSIQALLEKLPD